MVNILNNIDKRLLNVKEFSQYLNIGTTKARELLHAPDCEYAQYIGNRIYADKKLLDIYLDKCAKYKIHI